jgi:hypothetical protein
MRTDSEQRTTGRADLSEARQGNSLKNTRAASAPVPRADEIPADIPRNLNVTEPISLLPEEAASQFRSQWESIQSGFVDDPRRAVEQAGVLVEEALEKLTTVFENKREQFRSGRGDIPTEDLRQTLRHYRVLLNRLL